MEKNYCCPFCKQELSQSNLAKRKFCDNKNCNEDEPILTRFYIDVADNKIDKQCVRIGKYLLLNDKKNNKFSLFRRDSDYKELFSSKSLDIDPFDENSWNDRLNLILTFA
jgi:hypothetical protein